jgi:DNA-binding MarR family transcriptional regulator
MGESHWPPFQIHHFLPSAEGIADFSQAGTCCFALSRSANPERALAMRTAKLVPETPSIVEESETADAVGRQLVWDISAISAYMMRIADLLGKRIGVSGSQWITLMAIESLSSGEGVSVRDVAALLNVDGSFVSAQSKILEKQNLIRRKAAKGKDRRLVLLSLTESAVEKMNGLESSKRALELHVRGELEVESLRDLSNELLTMRRRLGRAMLLVAAGE